jgi:transcriptional regulator with XRE-family HTH domain
LQGRASIAGTRSASGPIESRLRTGVEMADEFGARLRRERERRKISLESIASNTKVNLSLFQDLERGDASRWPAGIFRRSFIRSYATAIGLDADAVAHEFLERFPDPVPDPGEAALDFLAAQTSDRPAFRLTLASTGVPFKRGRVLQGHLLRLMAVSLDATVVTAMGGLLFLALGAFWMPTALFTVGYYWACILLLGNTPGVCLVAPGGHEGSSGGRRGSARWTELLQAASGVWRRWSDAGSRRSISSSPSVPPPESRTLSNAG